MTTERLLDLAAVAPDCHDEDLLLLLREAHGLYQEGLQTLHRSVAERLGGLSEAALVRAADAAGVPRGAGRDRAEVILLLALAEWEGTPAALAYTQMAEDAARRGVCMIPEE
ncbi:hypothetical protein [Streptomyces sp. YIM 121038]|uniref:hypothetical protein n=1 Tax=Streptomyces sp. YIM 121038 TaxID=2136401 RepID=UPI002016B978|nr:hypothetical protein [Streptomyces sp. YIM 121038]